MKYLKRQKHRHVMNTLKCESFLSFSIFQQTFLVLAFKLLPNCSLSIAFVISYLQFLVAMSNILTGYVSTSVFLLLLYEPVEHVVNSSAVRVNRYRSSYSQSIHERLNRLKSRCIVCSANECIYKRIRIYRIKYYGFEWKKQ